MAEPTPSTPNASEAHEATPRLVAVEPQTTPGSAAGGAAATGAPERRSRALTWGLLVLLLLAVAAATVQSQRVTAMGERNTALAEELQALEVQLSGATLRIQTYEMQQSLVRSLTADIAARVNELQALVDQGSEGPTPVGGP